jgi:hypothetical protein
MAGRPPASRDNLSRRIVDCPQGAAATTPAGAGKKRKSVTIVTDDRHHSG